MRFVWRYRDISYSLQRGALGHFRGRGALPFLLFQYPAVAVLTVALSTQLACAGSPDAAPPGGTSLSSLPELKLASWKAATATDKILAHLKKKRRARWRTTFGSERRDRAKASTGALGINADVLLIQGARNIHRLRRLLPARHWRLILSQDYMRALSRLSRLPDDLAAYDIANVDGLTDRPITAIAVRYQRRLRVRAVKQLAGIAEPDAAAAHEKASPGAVAVQLQIGRKTVWLVSAHARHGCQDDIARCLTGAEKGWRTALGAGKRPVIAGIATFERNGAQADSSEDLRGDVTCAQSLYALLSQGGAKGGSVLPVASSPYSGKTSLGCLSIGNLPQGLP